MRLLWSGQLETVVKGWVRRQLVDEVFRPIGWRAHPNQPKEPALPAFLG